MKLKCLLLLSLLTGFAMFTPRVHAQAVEQGNVTIDGYYGFPNLMTSLFKAIAETNTTDPNLKVKGFGPVGGRVSYMVSDKIGVGLDIFYANSSFKYSDLGTDSLGNTKTYNYQLTNSRPRFLLRMDAHFGQSDVVDPYFAVGLGYSAAKYKFTTDDPGFDQTVYSTRKLLPIAYRIAFGTKFYFAKFLGAGLEVGLGGPLVTVGLTGKF